MDTNLTWLRHRKEKLYDTLVMAFGTLIWAVVILALAAVVLSGKGIEQIVVFLVEAAIFALVITIIRLFHRAYLYGHAVLIGEGQFPHLHRALQEGASRLGLKETPQAFLYNSNGLMNAFAMRVLRTRLVLLTSALIDVESEAQVDFVIGHELGHHAAGHLSPWKNLLKLPGLVIPFLGPAYHRARELTADRFGAYCVGDYDASRSALHMLACGSAKLNEAMNADAFAAQEELVPPVTGFLLHIFSGYPRLTARVNAVEDFFHGQAVADGGTVARQPA